MSAGAPTASVPSPATRFTIFAGATVVRFSTSSNDMPRYISFDIVVGMSKTGPLTFRL